MRTIEFSTGESRDENVPAGTVPKLTLLVLVRTSEAGFYFDTLPQYSLSISVASLFRYFGTIHAMNFGRSKHS